MTYNWNAFKRLFRIILFANMIAIGIWSYIKIYHIPLPFYNVFGISCIILLVSLIIFSIIGLVKFFFF